MTVTNAETGFLRLITVIFCPCSFGSDRAFWNTVWTLVDYQTLPHTWLFCFFLCEFLARKNCPCTPFSRYLAPYDFVLVLEVKITLKEGESLILPWFRQNLWTICAEFQTVHFTKFFERWCDRWARRVNAHGGYSEVDNMD